MAVGAAVKLAISLAFLIPGEVHAALPVLPKARARARDRAGAARRRLHPRLPAVGGLRRRRVDLGGRAHPADRLARREPVDARSTPRPQADRRTWTPGDLVALRALHRRRRGGDGGHPHRAARPADHDRRVRGRRAGHAAARTRGRRTAMPAAHRPRPARVVRVRRRRDRGAGRRPGAGRVRRRHGCRATRRAAQLASGFSACCSWPSPRASSASSASRRSRPRASRWSRCSARPRCSPRRAGSPRMRARGVLTVGTIVAVAASKAGDISQDLKTG